MKTLSPQDFLFPLTKRIAIAIAATLATTACSLNNQDSHKLSITGGNLALVSKPADPTTEIAQLQRYRGQTSFLDRQEMWRDGRAMPAPGGGAAAPQMPGAPGRAQQESDVFKVGAAGSKLLYLMNQYRGLQVVSFAKGAEQPELLGRAATSGNSVDQMYSDLQRNRLISIEHDYKYADGKDQSHSMLVVYDVTNSSKPEKQRVIDVAGLVMDSRIVGDVLYVASRQDDKGLVTSYSLTSSDFHQVEQRALSLPVAYGENMNIIQQDENYYLVAVLADKGWGWWQDASVIDVVDISDVKGKIVPMMSVATRGFVRERSQTAIKNRTLIVTSNYDTKTGRTPQLRIAVETFKFPETTNEILTDDEATFRRLNIERQLQNHYGADLDQLRDQLMNDAKLGLKGRFIKKGDTLKKIVSDSMVTVGDGSGLSAQLQDVRIDGNLLYAFWVPRDQIDPFDMFDISHPETGITYIGRLHFDGWIERAIPFNFGNRKFVLGLGWIEPVVDNDTGRRQPQAMIFEIKQAAGQKPKANDVAQLSLEGSNIWTNFNGADKMVEVRETTPGQGEILFGADRFEKGDYAGGGQIIRFDLSKVDTAGALTKGPFLSGGADWIRRVFTNTEIDRINSFSDHALATFSAAAGTADLHPVSILELARNIVGYEVVQGTGIQIVTDGYWASSGSTTDLRAVHTDNVDVEAAQVVSKLTLPGRYAGRLIDSTSGDLLVVTNEYTETQNSSGQQVYSSILHLARVTSLNGKLSLKDKVDWSTLQTPNDYVGLDDALVRLADGTLIIQAGTSLHHVDLSKALSSNDELAIDKSCLAQDRANFRLQLFNGATYFTADQNIDSKDFENERFIRHSLAKAVVQAKSVVCEASINIPGQVKAINANGDLLVEETWVTDLRSTTLKGGGKSTDAQTQHSLLSLKVSGASATLTDEIALANESRGMFYPRMAYMPCPGCMSRSSDFKVVGQELVNLRASGTNGQLDIYRVDADSMLEKDTRTFTTGFDGDANVLDLASEAGGMVTAVLKGEAQVQVVRWTKQDLRPQVLKLQAVNERNELQPATDVVTIAGSFWSAESVHFSSATPPAGSLEAVEIAQGWNGLTQLRIAK